MELLPMRKAGCRLTPRLMRHNPMAQPGWDKWTHRLGYSYKRGDLRADCSPTWKDQAEPWEARIWRAGDHGRELRVLRAPDHWRLGVLVMETVDQLLEGAACKLS